MVSVFVVVSYTWMDLLYYRCFISAVKKQCLFANFYIVKSTYLLLCFLIAVVHSEGSLMLNFVCSLFLNFRVSKCEDYMTEYEWLNSHVRWNADCTCQFIIIVMSWLTRKFLFEIAERGMSIKSMTLIAWCVLQDVPRGRGRLKLELGFY